MKTILVPTDFSNPSKIAVFYAVQLAKVLEADIILLAVINVNTSQTLLNVRKLEEEMVDMARNDAEQFIAEVRETHGEINITYRSILGFPFEGLVDHFAVDNKIDMIIMGTKGATGLKKVLMGSNAAAVIDNSSIPVIAVPEDTVFKPVQKIVYATDLVYLNEEIKTIALFAKIFDAAIAVLHVNPGESVTLDENKTAEELVATTQYPKISFHIARNNSIADALDAFVIEQHADILAMFTHKLDFYEKLFGRSVTRQLAFHAKVPLLTFNKTLMLHG